MTEQAGFEVFGKLYPIPESFTFGDTVLVADVTHLDFSEFITMVGDPERGKDPRIVAGLLAIAYKRRHRCSDKQAISFVHTLDLANFDFHGGDEQDEGDAAGPPAKPLAPDSDGSASSSTPSEPSNRSEGTGSAQVTPLHSGPPGLAGTSTSPQTAQTG